jgi:hypothetical protein
MKSLFNFEAEANAFLFLILNILDAHMNKEPKKLGREKV